MLLSNVGIGTPGFSKMDEFPREKTAKVNMSDLGLEIDASRSAGANITLQPHLKYSCCKVAIYKKYLFSPAAHLCL